MPLAYRGFSVELERAGWFASPGTLNLGPFLFYADAQAAIDQHLATVAEMDKVHEVPLDDCDIQLLIVALQRARSALIPEDQHAADELSERLEEARGG